MTIKAFAYSIQAHLKSNAGLSLRRSHIYELLAAAYGFGSYAALSAEHVFTEWPHDLARPALAANAIRTRSRQLGLDGERIASALEPLLRGTNLGPIAISEVAALILDDNWESPPVVLLEGLHTAADRGIAAAHRALATFYGEAWEGEGSAYWYLRQQAGQILTGVEAEWADNEKKRIERVAKHTYHLNEAARLNDAYSLLELAAQYGDPAFFEKGFSESECDPAEVAAIAEALGRDADAHYWYTVAAKKGHVAAMERLIELYDRDNPRQRWTWIYLAAHLGTDFLEDDLHAIHEDGSTYDDDVGGHPEIVGRWAIDVEPLEAQSELLAREAALVLLAAMSPADEPDDGCLDDAMMQYDR